jgi:hypothetical protein
LEEHGQKLIFLVKKENHLIFFSKISFLSLDITGQNKVKLKRRFGEFVSPHRKNFCQDLTFLKKLSLENNGLEGFISNFSNATASKK